MLFNSAEFLLLFLPITWCGFYIIAGRSHRWAAAWLAAASLAFYASWKAQYIGLLLASILANYGVGIAIATVRKQLNRQGLAQALLIFGIAADLAVLGWFKYIGFATETLHTIFSNIEIIHTLLPIGISFFTFTQIAFLVDSAQGKVTERNFVHYLLFVSYFPHLIAGPVLHHKEMMPQFGRWTTYRPCYENAAVGLTILAIGLFKKVILADNVAIFVKPAFDAAAKGQAIDAASAWTAAIAYALQLYFDFSGYSDMAIGLSRLFGVQLPLNFNSPYKAVNLIDFWRRWHMTLSRFLRDYLYIPLGGNRQGPSRRLLNLMITMVLGGLWHGAGWTWIAWGTVHGVGLVVNHLWHRLFGVPHKHRSRGALVRGRVFTFLLVTIAWVFFRSDSLPAAGVMLAGMVGLHGVAWTPSPIFAGGPALAWVGGLLAIVWILPNTQEIMAMFRPAMHHRSGKAPASLLWQPNIANGLIYSTIFAVALFGVIVTKRVSEFMYFQF